MPEPKSRGQTRGPVVIVLHEFGDTDLTVREHPDGRFTLDLPIDGPLVMTPDEFRSLLEEFAAAARVKGWKV